jgi:solute:Na+ symporter, SSS family
MKFALDAVVLLAYFGIIVGIGLSQRKKNDSVEGYTLGDRQIAWWAVLASILAAEISAATFLGAPESGYTHRNWTYAQFAIGTIIARVIVSFIFIPLFYRHGVISLYEYLETRFGGVTRRFASGTFAITRVLAIGTRLYVAAIIVVLAWQLWKGPVVPEMQFMIFAVALTLISLLTAVYTMVGGIRAVIWTDFIQVSVLCCALIFTIFYLLGKLPEGWQSAKAVIEYPAFFDFAKPEQPGLAAWVRNVLTADYTLWTAIIGITILTMSTHGIDQDTVQRMLTARNRRQSAFATIMSGIIDLPVVSAFIFIGVLLYAYYLHFPDPTLPRAADGTLETRNVFPHFILTQMPAGLRGLVVAGIMATAMGSLSTALNALATSFARDFLLHDKPDMSELHRIKILRRCTFAFALAIIAVGVVTSYYVTYHPKTQIIPLVLGILGFTFGSLLGIFLVGIVFKTRGNDLGNVIAMILGFAAVVFCSRAELQNALGIENPLILAFPWRIACGALVTILVAVCFPTPQDRITATAAVSG